MLLHAQTYVQKLRSPSGEITAQSSKIASGFQEYYAQLYNLTPDQSLDTQTPRSVAIRDYLTSAAVPPLNTDQRADLELQITPGEIESIVKSLPNGKSPGPDGYTGVYYKGLSAPFSIPYV